MNPEFLEPPVSPKDRRYYTPKDKRDERAEPTGISDWKPGPRDRALYTMVQLANFKHWYSDRGLPGLHVRFIAEAWDWYTAPARRRPPWSSAGRVIAEEMSLIANTTGGTP